MLAETAFQLVGMITSSVNIFKHATELFGPFGVPIAVASVAAMFGAFAVAKVKAMQAINDTNKFADGGEIDGASHTAGGGFGCACQSGFDGGAAGGRGCVGGAGVGGAGSVGSELVGAVCGVSSGAV